MRKQRLPADQLKTLSNFAEKKIPPGPSKMPRESPSTVSQFFFFFFRYFLFFPIVSAKLVLPGIRLNLSATSEFYQTCTPKGHFCSILAIFCLSLYRRRLFSIFVCIFFLFKWLANSFSLRSDIEEPNGALISFSSRFRDQRSERRSRFTEILVPD